MIRRIRSQFIIETRAAGIIIRYLAKRISEVLPQIMPKICPDRCCRHFPFCECLPRP